MGQALEVGTLSSLANSFRDILRAACVHGGSGGSGPQDGIGSGPRWQWGYTSGSTQKEPSADWLFTSYLGAPSGSGHFR